MITILMGYGCAVPAIISSRTATTRKERLIISTVVCLQYPAFLRQGINKFICCFFALIVNLNDTFVFSHYDDCIWCFKPNAKRNS